MKKRSTIILTAAALTAALAAALTAEAKEFPDVPEEHWAYEYIAEMSEQGILAGDPDGNFYPENAVNRGEFAKIMTLALGVEVKEGGKQTFIDVTHKEWSFPYVEAAKNYLSGYVVDGEMYYYPERDALREDIAVALVKLKGYTPDEDAEPDFNDLETISKEALPYVAAAVENGLIMGDENGNFRGQDTLTRAEAAALLYRAAELGNDNKTFDVADEDEADKKAADKDKEEKDAEKEDKKAEKEEKKSDKEEKKSDKEDKKEDKKTDEDADGEEEAADESGEEEKKYDPEEIWAIEKADDFVVAMLEMIFDKCDNGENLDALNDEERVLFVAQNLLNAVKKDGFEGYLSTECGNTANEAAMAFRLLGAENTAILCERAFSIFGMAVPATQAERVEELEKLTDAKTYDGSLEQSDKAFAKLKEDITSKMYAFITEYEESFR